MSPRPEEITRIPEFPFDLRITELRVPRLEPFTITSFLKNREHYSSYSIADYDSTSKELLLVSEAPLNIELQGDAPAVAWLPTEHTTVTAGKYPDASPLHSGVLTIQEHIYPFDQEKEFGSEPEGKALVLNPETRHILNPEWAMASPGVDVLGPIAMWSDSRLTVYGDGLSHPFYSSLPEDESTRIFTVVEAFPAFSMRAVMQPLTDMPPEDVELDDIPDVQTKPNAQLLEVTREEEDAGVDLFGTSEATAQYKELLKSLGASEEVTRAIPGTGFGMPFRYTSLPVDSSLSVSGYISDITFDGTTGRLGRGLSSRALESPAVVEVKNIKALNAQGSIPILFRYSGNDNHVRLITVADIYVDEHQVDLDSRSMLSGLIKATTLISTLTTIVAGIFTILAFYNKTEPAKKSKAR